MSRVLVLSVLGCCLGVAQTTKIDLQNQSRGVDFSAAPYTKPVKTGSALPPTCSTGEAYLLTTAVPGANFFVCTATNIWTLQGGQGGVSDHSQLTHLDYASSGHTGFQPALGFTPINSSTLGLANGPAKLGSDGKILASELPTSTGATVSFAMEQYTGDGSRRLFTLAATPLDNSLAVSVDGQLQEQGALADYTLTGLTITFNSSSTPSNSGRISFRYATSTGSGSLDVAYAADTASGNGTQSTFSLSSTPLIGSLLVTVNGQIQEPGALADYTVTGKSVIFNAPSIPGSGARITFRYGYSLSGSSGNQSSGAGGGTQAFLTPATSTWTVPSGVTRVFVQAWAGGGGGAAGYFSSGVGGGGGGYAEAWCPVTAGSTLIVVVGSGGAGGVGGAAPGAGGDSIFGTCVRALGGGEGTQKDNAYYPGKDASMPDGYYFTSGGAFFNYSLIRSGSPCSGCFPSRNDQGGSGGSYVSVNKEGMPGSMSIFGGGGGGSGANADSSSTQAGGAGGTSSRGGNGGNGSGVAYSTATGCTAGMAPSGGGGGGAWNGLTVLNGCAGARGQVTLWW